MTKFILGKKLGMTTLYDAAQGAQNVTLIECAANKVGQIRTKERDGYTAVQLIVSKTTKKQHIKEFRVAEEDLKNIQAETPVTIEAFQVGDKVRVTGTTKSKGFQGVVKRHGFGGAPKSHGRKHDWRKPGSIGSGFPEHVTKGKKMAGRMGGERSSVKNLKVVYIDAEKNILGVKGAVPGVVGRIVEIRG